MEKKQDVKEAKQTMADKIWEEIKNARVDVFGIPDQVVSDYLKPLPVDPNKCHVTYNASAVIPALDVALPKFNVEHAGKYLVITKK